MSDADIVYGIGAEDYQRAEGIADHFDGSWRYDFSLKLWHGWDGVRWAPDKTGQVKRAVAEYAATRLRDISSGTETERKSLMKLLSIGPIDKSLEALSTMPGYGTDGSDWDQIPYFLGCENGVVDLRSNTINRNPSPECLVSRTTGHTFRPVSGPSEFYERAPHFMDFLDQITSEDPEVSSFLLLWFGASLFGFTPEQRFLLMTGIGRNGKGALKTAILNAVGEYGAQPDGNVYMRSKMGAARSDGARADLMDLKGRRVTFFSEPEGNRFNDELLKAHTGGDMITARPLFSNNVISWEPTHSITFLVNNAPEVEDLGPSMGARVMVADFRERYEGDKEDKTLYRTLKGEADGILAILCWAAREWYASWDQSGVGITLPQRIEEQSKQFMERNDVIAAWMNDAAEYDQTASTQTARLYESYLQWHSRSDRGDEAMSQVRFSQGLERKGFKKVKRSNAAYFGGLRLLNAVQIAENAAEGDE